MNGWLRDRGPLRDLPRWPRNGPRAQRSGLLYAVLTAITALLALHILLILFTGGYTVKLLGAPITGHRIVAPTILLLGLVIVCRWLKFRGRSSGAFSGHVAAHLFLASLIVYLANGKTLWSGDTLPARYLPLSVLREGNFDLDEFSFLYDGKTFPSPWFLWFAHGHFVSSYPVGAALFAVPLYLPSALGHITPQSPVVEDLEKLSAATIVALSAVVLYLTLRRLTSLDDALLITAVYALGTSSLSESSQALWQHGASQLALAVALYCLVRGRREAHWAALAGFPLAFAIISRPTDILIALPLGIYVLAHQRRHVWGFLLSGLPPAIFQLWYNATYFGNPARAQFVFTISTTTQDLLAGAGMWTTPIRDGLAGILVSPGRGLFVYSPIFVFSLVGLGLAWRRHGDLLLRYATPGVFLTILVYSKWATWWGGSSYGPRLLADLDPVLALSLYPVGPALRRSRALKAVFIVLVVWSVGAHSIGAFADDRSWNWNGNADVDHYPERLWSWKDNQLVNPLRDALHRVMIAARHLPTSRTAPTLLSASYRTDLPSRLVIDCGKSVPTRVSVTNVGRAAWLVEGAHDTGLVRLGWRWRNGSPLSDEGRVHLGSAVLPGQSHEFHASIPSPRAPGTYLLEVGLVDEHVAWFSERGIAPIRMVVTVDAAPQLSGRTEAFSTLLESLRVVADHAPRVVVSTDRPRYRQGEVLHLTVTGTADERSWVMDTYLLLRGPDGAVWFHDGRRLIRSERCRWTPLATARHLGAGHRDGVLIDLLTAEIPAGAYTWHLLLTEVDRYRIIAEAQTSFEIGTP